MILVDNDIRKMKDMALSQFENCVNDSDQGNCYSFDEEVVRLETKLLSIYSIVASSAKNEDSLEAKANLWGFMTEICDDFASKLSELIEQHPACSASHDKILEIRNRCQSLKDLHS